MPQQVDHPAGIKGDQRTIVHGGIFRSHETRRGDQAGGRERQFPAHTGDGAQVTPRSPCLSRGQEIGRGRLATRLAELASNVRWHKRPKRGAGHVEAVERDLRNSLLNRRGSEGIPLRFGQARR